MGGHILTQRAWDIAFGIYVTAELNMEPALLYCSMCGAVDKAYTKEVLQRRYLAEDLEELQLIAQPRCNSKNPTVPNHNLARAIFGAPVDSSHERKYWRRSLF